MAFIDLKAQQRKILPDLERRIAGVLEHGQYIMGPEITELEEKLAAFVGVKHAISCSSGTDALLMPLMAYGVGPGDAILTTPFTFIATAEVISLTGATPVFVDIDPDTYNIDPVKLEQKIEQIKRDGKYTLRGIIPVDLFGLPADYDAIMQIAAKHDLFIMEDAAQSFGATYKGRKAGSLGHVGATSFFPAKPLGCYGDGGAIFMDDDNLAEIIKSLRVHGKGKDQYDNVRVGLNGRFDTIQAAILLAKLEIFPGEIKARAKIAEGYSKGLKDIVKIPMIPDGYTSAWAQYSILSDRRQEIMKALAEAKIPTMVYYPTSLHLQGAFTGLGYQKGDFPHSESISERIFSLPMHPYLTEKQQAEIITLMNQFC
ncbi:MAG: DegT/DnrJ/EryC1/StrS family aminotransferase [Proteobacteria bacterium]|nr:DegT/DnrJ/EryC1/StrS family aminotransferase [Pseudomonadota bacterium]